MSKNVYRLPVVSFDNYDGDTVNVITECHSEWRDTGWETQIKSVLRQPRKVRLLGVDTPELNRGSPEHRKAGRYAADFVTRWLARGIEQENLHLVSIDYKEGKFGRALGDFKRGDLSLVAVLLENRLGVAYEGQHKSEVAAAHEANIRYLQETGKI